MARKGTAAWEHRAMAGTLYLVGTPIGNLGDMSQRARETLAAADVIAAEDTRRAGRLLQRFGIEKRRFVSLFDANEEQRTGDIVRHLRDDRSVAVVSDGGMPLVSDPGFRLVRACVAEGIEVVTVPGPSAAIAAIVVSGLPTDRFAFEGFPPRKKGERTRRLEELRADPRTLVFFESPVRVRALLSAMQEVLGDRSVAVCRELTKLHEEVTRGSISEVLASLGDRPIKGEIVVVVDGEREPSRMPLEDVVAEARELVAGGMKKRAAARTAADRHGAPTNEVYRALVGRL
jgi:16S rRNA (cytidine1402-2'-O)-methyltransferase